MRKSPTLGHGKICYLEIPSGDVKSSALFYERVFGWRNRKRGDGVISFDDGVGEVSGIWVAGRPPAGIPHIVIHIMVKNAEETMACIKANGGKIVQGVGADLPEITARFADPYGNVFGIYQDPSLKD
jgi:hypothetical protein